jgi:uracil phosphoribosyltransferase
MTITVNTNLNSAGWDIGEGGVHVLPQTARLRALHTVIRDRQCDRSDFVHSAGAIMRTLIETALALLPHQEQEITTAAGYSYAGLRPARPVCGVSVVRAGDSMETAVRAALPASRLGKILIQRDKVTKLPHLYYSALPPGIADAHVLLLDPMLATGGTALAALDVLREAGVTEQNVVFVNLLSAPEGIAAVRRRYPDLVILTSSVEQRLNENAFMVPGIGDFGDRYFGTDAK